MTSCGFSDNYCQKKWGMVLDFVQARNSSFGWIVELTITRNIKVSRGVTMPISWDTYQVLRKLGPLVPFLLVIMGREWWIVLLPARWYVFSCSFIRCSIRFSDGSSDCLMAWHSTRIFLRGNESHSIYVPLRCSVLLATCLSDLLTVNHYFVMKVWG